MLWAFPFLGVCSMATDTSVKFFHSVQTGAPSLTNAAGSLIGILDACLVNGFGSLTVSSAVVSGGVLTLTFAATHSFVKYGVARISGITDSGYTDLNGDFRVASVPSTTSITLDATGFSDATLTSTITALVAPLGWTKAFSGTNLAVYQSADSTSTGMYFAFNDASTQYTAVRGYESMTAVSTGTNPFPTTSQASTWQWYKSVDSTARGWSLWGDTKTVYFMCFPSSSYPNYPMTQGFGDFAPVVSSDSFRAFITGTTSSDSANNPWAQYTGIGTSDPSYSGPYAPRSYNGIPGIPARLYNRWQLYNYCNNDGGGYISGSPGSIPWPNPIDGGLTMSDFYLLEGYNLRGRMRGVYGTAQATGRTLAHATIFTNISSRNYMYSWNTGNNSGGGIFFDITGPWS